MADRTSKTGTKPDVSGGAGRRGRTAGKSATTGLFIGPEPALAKKMSGVKVRVPIQVSKVLTGNPKQMKALLKGYGDAFARSRAAGRPAGFRVVVDPDGSAIVMPDEEMGAAPESALEETSASDAELRASLAAARERGRLRAAEILAGDDMLSADAFAKMLGTTRVTVSTWRRSGQILGLDGAKRGFRFPVWQLDTEGKPYAELAMLHDRLGGSWAVYRFLVQPHGELDGLTGREALERGMTRATLEAAESIGRTFR